jgi:hypothetical protein
MRKGCLIIAALIISIVSVFFLLSSRYKFLVLKENCQNALTLALENNIKFRGFSKKWCGKTLTSSVQSNLFMLPLNKEIIDAALDFKCAEEHLNNNVKEELRNKSYNLFINSGETVFILIIINNNLNLDESIQIPSIKSNITLKTENGHEFKVCDFTPSLGVNLNPGWNAGYVYFKGNIPSSVQSYSIHFKQLSLTCGEKSDNYSWAFAFDQTDMKFLSLLQGGMRADDIRKKFLISSYKDSGISRTVLENIISFVIHTVSRLILA